MASKTPKPDKPENESPFAKQVLRESFTDALEKAGRNSKSGILGGMFAASDKGAGTAGILAGGAIGALTSAIGRLTSVLDPVLGSAKKGFESGMGRGMGLETLEKSFSMLGVVVGMQFAPALTFAAGATMAFAKKLSETTLSMEKIRDGFNSFMDKGGFLLSPPLELLRQGAKPIAKNILGDDWAKDIKENMKIAQKSFELGLRKQSPTSYSDLSSVREQIAMSAAVDPMERETQKIIQDMLPQYQQQMDRLLSLIEGK
jgi:hypothetical protein